MFFPPLPRVFWVAKVRAAFSELANMYTLPPPFLPFSSFGEEAAYFGGEPPPLLAETLVMYGTVNMIIIVAH